MIDRDEWEPLPLEEVETEARSKLTRKEANVEALQDLEGIRTVREIEAWIHSKYGNRWNSITTMAEMVLENFGGNPSSRYLRTIGWDIG